MTDPLSTVRTLRRPRLLVEAAQRAAVDYDRDRVLRRVLRATPPTGPMETLIRLLDAEDALEEARAERRASYVPSRHVSALAAIIAEASGMAARSTPDQYGPASISALRSAT